MATVPAHPVCIVTGGSSGIGAALASVMIEEGWEVGVVSRRHPSEWPHRPPPPGDSAGWIETDLGGLEAAVGAVTRWVADKGGVLDALVHAAVSYGEGPRHTFDETTIEEWDELFSVNARAQFGLTRALLASLRRSPRGAHVVGISTDAAVDPAPGRVAYAASKAASYALLRSLAAEIDPSEVLIFQVTPDAVVDTPGIRKRRPPQTDFQRYGSAREFGKRVVWLLNERPPLLHGTCTVVPSR